jgi:hypothetical protein
VIRKKTINDLKVKIRESVDPFGGSNYRNFKAYNAAHADDLNMPDYNSIKSILSTEKTLNLPENPIKYSDIPQEFEYYQTLRGDRFLLFKSKELMIFSSEPMLKILSQADKVYTDGKFYVCPEMYKQVFII